MKATALYHPEYAEHCEAWQAIEDVCAGGRRIKSKNETYLPKLSGETDEEYKNRKFRAVFFNATKRTREALVGMLTRKAPKVKVPTEDESLTSDIDLEGATVKNWVRTVAQQVVSTGRGVTVADWSDTESRPYLAFYPATMVCNWSVERIDGRSQLTLLVLKECAEQRIESTVSIVEQFREYSIDPDTKTVVMKVWTIGKESELDGTVPKPLMRKGVPLTEIPAVFHNASHLGPSVGQAPLLDVADLNLAHYNGSADLENGRHICGIPTPYATGVQDDNNTLKLGSTKAWTTTEPNAKFGFIEFEGKGLSELVTGQEEKERHMAVLGARLLFDNKKDAESYETVRLRSVSETASLSNMSGYLTATLTQAIRWFCWWNSTLAKPSDLPDDIGVQVNDDFVDTPLTEGMLTALTAALQGNAISVDTFFFQLEQGEIYPEGWDLQKEIAAIAQRPVVVSPPAPPTPPAPDPSKKPAPTAA